MSTADRMSGTDDDHDVIVMNGRHSTKRSSPSPPPHNKTPTRLTTQTVIELRRTTRTRSSGAAPSPPILSSPSPPPSTSPSPPNTTDSALSRKRSSRELPQTRTNGANNNKRYKQTDNATTDSASTPSQHIPSRNGATHNAQRQAIVIDANDDQNKSANAAAPALTAAAVSAAAEASASSASAPSAPSSSSSPTTTTTTTTSQSKPVYTPVSFSFEPNMTFLPPERIIIPSLTASMNDESKVDVDETVEDDDTDNVLDPAGFKADLTNILPRPPLLPMSRYPHAFLTVWARYMQSVHRPMEGHIVQVQNKRVSAYDVYRSVVFLGGYGHVNRYCLWHECMMGILETAQSMNDTSSELPPVAPLTAHTFKIDPLQPKSFIQSYYEHYLYHFEQTYQWQSGFAPKYDLNKSIVAQMKQINYGLPTSTTAPVTTATTTTTSTITPSMSLSTPATTIASTTTTSLLATANKAGISLDDLRLKIIKSLVPASMHADLTKAFKSMPSRTTNSTATATTTNASTSTGRTSASAATTTAASVLGYGGMRFVLYSLRSMQLNEVTSALETLLKLSQRIANSPTEYRCAESELVFDISDTTTITGEPPTEWSDRERDCDDASDNGLIFYFDIISALIPLLMYAPIFRQYVDDDYIIARDKQEQKINYRIKHYSLSEDIVLPQHLPVASPSLLSLQVDEKMYNRAERWPDVHSAVLTIIENLSQHMSNTRRIARHISFINICLSWLDDGEERRLLYLHRPNDADETINSIIRILTNCSEWLHLSCYANVNRLFYFVHTELAYYLHEAVQYNEKFLSSVNGASMNDHASVMDDATVELYESSMHILLLMSGLCLSPYRRDNMRALEHYLLQPNHQWRHDYPDDGGDDSIDHDDNDDLNDFVQILFLLCGDMHFILPIREAMQMRECATQLLLYLTANSHVVYQFIFVSCSPLLNLIIIQNLLINILKDDSTTTTATTTTTTANSTAMPTATNSPTAAATNGAMASTTTNNSTVDTSAVTSNNNNTSTNTVNTAALIADIQHLRRHTASLLFVIINGVLKETDPRLKALGQRWIFSIEGEIFAAIMNDWDVSHILGGTFKQLAAMIQEEEEKNI